MSIKITGVTANCGNSTIGEKASESIVGLLSTDGPGVVVINCQEVNYAKQLAQLKAAIAGHPNLQLVQSGLMVTRTKFERDVIAGGTGIATFVLYDTNKIGSVTSIFFAPCSHPFSRSLISTPCSVSICNGLAPCAL